MRHATNVKIHYIIEDSFRETLLICKELKITKGEYMMTEKEAKFSKAIVKGSCWILKCFFPSGPFQGILQDVFDECAGYIVDSIDGGKSIQELLEDESLESLGIPEQQYELVRYGIIGIFDKIIIDDNIFKDKEYEPRQIVDYLWENFCGKGEYGFEEELNIKKILYKIILQVLTVLTKDDSFLITLLNRIQKLVNDMKKQKKETDVLRERIDELERITADIGRKPEIKLVGKEIQYKKNWNTTLFLNGEDPKVYLKDVYQLPEYYWKTNKKDVKNDLQEKINKFVIKKKNNVEMLLVLGKPGAGKSTLITYIINFYEDISDKRFLVFPFSILKNIEWNSNNTLISDQILHEIGITNIYELNNYILILDGLDEVSIEGNRENIINKIYEEWVKNTVNLDISVIITCRENYLQQIEKIQCNFVTLCLLNEQQIENFCKAYWEKVRNNRNTEIYVRKLCMLREIVGVPLVLYMTVALDVDVTGTTTICDVYDKIFCLEDGIYDRCEYSAMGHPLTSPLKRQIHDITKNISIKMWRDNPEQAFISQRQYEQIVVNEDQKNSELKSIVLIGQYFQYVKYCEGIQASEIRFVHRSIYEYFVALTIFDTVSEYLEIPNREMRIEDLEMKLLVLLRKRQLSIDIEGYLTYKIKKKLNKIQNEYKTVCYEWWKEFFNKLLVNGMGEGDNHMSQLNKIDSELVGFVNLTSLLRIIADGCKQKSPYCFYNEGTALQVVNNESPKICMEKYIRYACEAYQNKSVKYIDRLDLSKLVLEKFDFSGINLSSADFSNADLQRSSFYGCNLRKTNFTNARLQKCDFRAANLSSANLEEARMQNSRLLSTNLSKANWLNTYMIKEGMAESVCKNLPEGKIIWTENFDD